MMDLLANIVFCTCALIAFIYASIHYLRPRQALYKKMLACAMGCIFLERLYELVQILIAGDVPEGFNVGMIGVVGFYLFIFSAHYGAIDRLIDNKSKELKKYRIIALAGPAFMIMAAVLVVIKDVPLSGKICVCAEEASMGLAIYYNIKHMIIPEEYADMFISLRPYNACIILLAVAMTIENVVWYAQINGAVMVVASMLLQSILILMSIPLLESGIRRWQI